jgi:O-antigen polymerase
MNISKTRCIDAMQRFRFAAGAVIMLVGLTFTFFNTFGVSFTSARAPSLLGWLCASVVTAYLVFFTKKEKTNWAAFLFFVLFLFIVIRQGPKPIHSTALALIVLTMTCVAHSATLFARDLGWAVVFAVAVMLIATLNALVALYQYFGLSIQYPIPYVEITPQGMAIGQVRQRNQMAILCALGLVTLAYFPNKLRWVGSARFGLGLCLIAAAAVSASRIGAVAIFLFSCTLIFTFRSLTKSSQQLVGFAFPIFLILTYLLPLIVEDKSGLLSRLANDTFAVRCSSRLVTWENALSLIWRAPWSGAGWGGFIGEYYMSDLPARGCEMIDHAHNVYLQIAVEAGLPAAALLIVCSLWFFVKHRCVVGEDNIYRWAYFSIGLIWVYSQVEFPLWETGFLWLFAIFLGVCATRQSTVDYAASHKVWHRLLVVVNRQLILLIMLMTACLSAMALMQFFRVASIVTSTDWERQITKQGYQELVKENWMFANRLEFIAAQLQRPTAANAEKINKFCTSVITYSPDLPIIMCVIRSAYLMGDMKQVEFHKQRILPRFARGGDGVDMYKKELDSIK